MWATAKRETATVLLTARKVVLASIFKGRDCVSHLIPVGLATGTGHLSGLIGLR